MQRMNLFNNNQYRLVYFVIEKFLHGPTLSLFFVDAPFKTKVVQDQGAKISTDFLLCISRVGPLQVCIIFYFKMKGISLSKNLVHLSLKIYFILTLLAIEVLF